MVPVGSGDVGGPPSPAPLSQPQRREFPGNPSTPPLTPDIVGGDATFATAIRAEAVRAQRTAGEEVTHRLLVAIIVVCTLILLTIVVLALTAPEA